VVAQAPRKKDAFELTMKNATEWSKEHPSFVPRTSPDAEWAKAHVDLGNLSAADRS
jgi:hypothetical protein